MIQARGTSPVARILLALLLLPAPLRAQQGDTASQLSVSLVTMAPSDAIYEIWGHNMIAIRLGPKGVAYNYGIFDLEEEGFLLQFLQGRMYYRMAGTNLPRTIDLYKEEKRTIWEQSLRLFPNQRLELARYLDWNQLPENQRYRYDYYTENCSTKVRDALDRAIGGELKRQLQGVPTGHTLRWQTRRMTRVNPVFFTAIDFGLGQYADRPIDAWEECFLPDRLMDYLRRVKVQDESGQWVPFVQDEQVIHIGVRPPIADGPPNWMVWFIAAGLVIGSVLTGLARWSRTSRFGRWTFLIFAVLWLLLIVGASLFMIIAWTLTSHVAAHRNENLFQFNPLTAPLLVLLLSLIFGRTRRWRWAMILGLIAVASSLLGLIVKVFPLFYQVNGEMIALMLPANLGLAASIYLLRPRLLDSRPSERR